MRALVWALVLLALLVSCKQPTATTSEPPAPGAHVVQAVEEVPWSAHGCTRGGCHEHIEPIRQLDSGMMKAILAKGRAAGDADGCIVCHGGTPDGATAADAHHGTVAALASRGGPDDFFPDPASPWVNPRSCGQCHVDQLATQWNSLMMQESGKIQGTAWTFGSLEGYEHKWGNYASKNNPERIGTDDYRAYMKEKSAAHPNVFQPSVAVLPGAPATADIAAHPEQAAFTYIRSECQRCHLGVKGRETRGDFRGMGCGACHIPYGVEGFYEGHDTSIPHDKPGHLLTHAIQSSRDAPLSVHGIAYSGVPVETCATCHNRGKRIGVSYQGLMESAYDSPHTAGGMGQTALHAKSYIAMQADIHYQKGMFCQDCHTSGDLHGDGFLAGTNLGGVEIECTDCHGTPTAYPWELPLGWGDENRKGAATGPARGVAHAVSEAAKQGWVAPEKDGWLRSARGNPLTKVTRDGDTIVVHTAGGKDLPLTPLKKKVVDHTLSVEATTAMVNVAPHIEKMECYSCHSAWAPQCYGCHVEVDFSKQQTSFDWVNAGHAHATPEGRTLRGESTFNTMIPGVASEMRSYMRWEDPVLGVNGEGRVTPVVPGCQLSATVIGPNGDTVLLNHIFRTTPGTEGSGPEGQLASDMAPTTPHTVGKARPCESCHGSEKAAGYGLGGGKMAAPMASGRVVDMTTQSGNVISTHARPQIEPIAGLNDWTQIVTRDGKQTQTVGNHFLNDGPLDADQRARLDRQNVCVGCHQNIPDGDVAISMLHHAAEMTGKLPRTNPEHSSLLSKIARIAAWAQVLAGLAVAGLVILVSVLLVRRRRRLRAAAAAP